MKVGDDSVIPAPMPALDLVLSDLLDSRLPDALAALRRYRRHAVALADWRAEREAGTRLGDVHAARLAADPSGNVRRSLAAHLPDKPQYEDLRNNLGHDIRRSVRIALKAAD